LIAILVGTAFEWAVVRRAPKTMGALGKVGKFPKLGSFEEIHPPSLDRSG
jgi:hypothetical protein